MSMKPLDLAVKYMVDDLPSADVPFTRLQNVLGACLAGKPLSASSEEFLSSRGLVALIALAKRETDEETFRCRALNEQQRRRVEAEERRLSQSKLAELQATQREARQAAMWAEQEAARLRAERDPRNIAKRKNRELRDRFGVVDYVEEDVFPRLMSILKSLDKSQRLSEESVAWLAAAGREYRTKEIMHSFHRIEADHYLSDFKASGNLWSAVSASSHLRKCASSREAHELLTSIPQARLSQAKLRSAVLTTHGGALRDLHRHEEAIGLAEEAHELVQSNYMPCTLLGAIHMELGQIAEGQEWYAKAEARGAPRDDIDREVRAILSRLPAAKRTAIIDELMANDALRYEWLRKAF